ncbi:Hypothetical_protein [Hexamita inflata]|uniref:Hypothetical_protein n=1 Tax=Hexamita inflata TaxID=28002 RepID=A0AA86QEL8_9EUKA|nr:Hypothetical protein HINF_LOCUS39249 [Hexamita inflata]
MLQTDSEFIRAAGKVMHKNFSCSSVSQLTLDIMMLSDQEYLWFWSELAYELNIMPEVLKRRYQSAFVTQSFSSSRSDDRVFYESGTVSSKSVDPQQFLACFVNQIVSISGKAPQLHQIQSTVKKYEPLVWNLMSVQMGLSEDVLKHHYSAEYVYKRQSSYRLSESDKKLLAQLAVQNLSLKPKQVIDIFIRQRRSNYAVDRHNAIMFVVQSRQKCQL